jgi:hypothetical protein
MAPPVVVVSQICGYCLEPFERFMIPVAFRSRRRGNSQIWLHMRCLRVAFAGAAAPIVNDLEDLAVDLGDTPSA